MKSTNYGWCYDKQGNIKTVYPPITSDGKEVRKNKTTITGAIPDNVGLLNIKAYNKKRKNGKF